MAETKGIVIEFKGDTVEFDKSLDGVNKGLKTLKNEMAQINKQLKLDPSNVDLLKRKFSNLKEQQKVVAEQTKLYKKELDEMSQKDIGSKKWVELQKKLGDAEVELQKLNKEVDKMSKTNFGALALGQSLEDASKKTKALADDLKGLSAVGTAVLGSIIAISLEAGKQADEINTLAKQYNLTTEQIQQFQMASDLIDVDLSTITKSYAKLTKNMTSTSKDVQNAFKELGVEVKDSNGELRSSNDVFNELISALGEVENETLQDNLAMQIFGKSASELGPLINGGAEQLKQFNKYLSENGLLLSQDQLDELNALNDAFDTIKATLKGFAQKIASDYAPMITKALKKINDVILKLKKWWDDLSPTIKKFIPIVAGVVGALAPLLTAFSLAQSKVGKLIKSFAMGNGGLGGALSKLTSPIGIVVAILGTLYATNEEFRDGVNEVVNTLKENLQPILEIVGERIGTLTDKLSKFLKPIIEKIVAIFINYIFPILNKIINTFAPIIEDVLNTVFDILEWLVDVLGDLWDFLEDIGVIDFFAQAFDKLGGVIEDVVGWIKSAWEWFTNLIAKAKEFLGIQDEIEKNGTIHTSRYGTSHGGGGGSFASGGFNAGGFTMNSTININTNRQITKQDVMSWADVITNRVNDNLGRLM